MVYDVAIIGGGINGCGIARDLAGQGVSVLLLEKNDLASGTSSASTKLIHGGLRYLEQGAFSMVRESLAERETLLSIAPHAIRPLRFILPHVKSMRPRALIQAGLFLYDNLAARSTLPASRAVRLDNAVLHDTYRDGFSYADCWADDARLVVLNARAAAKHGATIKTRTPVTRMEQTGGAWRIQTPNGAFLARCIVNAAGPWARLLLEGSQLAHGAPRIRWTQGSHIVVPGFIPPDAAYILQQPDRRIVFAIPYEGRFTLIGTTERDIASLDPPASMTAEEEDYLCRAAGLFFKKPIGRNDIVWRYAGVRPLIDDGKADARIATRDYKIMSSTHEGAPLVSVFGGKLTVYRRVAEDVSRIVMPHLGRKSVSWTGATPLPGGDTGMPFDDFKNDLARQFPQYPATHIERMTRAYGTDAPVILQAGTQGGDYGTGLFEAEIDHLVRHEWARTADDVLWRRTKRGLHASPDTVSAIVKRMEG